MQAQSETPAGVGPFRLEQRIGSGGMGEVYLATDQRLGRRVAVKRLLPGRDGEVARARLRREASAVARLSHPAIVQLFDILEDASGDWLVMEYVDGPRLADLLHRGPIAVEQAVEWGRQLAEGLAEAHAKGFVHRDLKAENVLIGGGRVKILDFGLVRELAPPAADDTALSQTGTLLGTVRTMAPEQALGQTAGPRADLFSLGVLLYEMVSGRSPFLAPSAVETLRNLLERPPPPLAAELPAELARLIAQLLEKAPELRPPDAAAVARRLAALGGRGAEPGAAALFAGATTEAAFAGAPAFSTSSIAEPPRSRRRLAIALVIVGLVLAGSALWFRGHGAPVAAPVTTSVPAADLGTAQLEEEGWKALERFDQPEQVERSIARFQRALETAPESANALAGLARADWRKYFLDSKDRMWLAQAVAVARRAVASDGASVVARVSLGLALAGAGETAAARAELDQALALDPRCADAVRGLGALHLAAGEPGEAETAFRRALELRPDDAEVYDYLSGLYFGQERLDDAEAAARRSIALRPDGIVGYRNLAAIHITRGELDQALAVLDTALAIRPSALLYLNQGTAFFYQGLYPQAAAAWEKALELPSGSNSSLTWANLGDAYRQIPHRRGEAPEAFRQAIRLLEPKAEQAPTPQRLSQLALYRAKAGQGEAAEREIERAAATDDPRALFRLVLAAEILGRRERALELLARALGAGFQASEIEREPDLAALRSDPRYHRLRGGGSQSSP